MRHANSRHWRNGIVVDNSFHGRGLVTVDRNRVTVRVRGHYPQFFANQLTDDIRDLVESTWRGAKVRILIPCGSTCAVGEPGSGLFDIEDLYAAKAEQDDTERCKRCRKRQNIDDLLLGRALPLPNEESRIAQAVANALRPEFAEVVNRLNSQQVTVAEAAVLSRRTLDAVDLLNDDMQKALGRIEEQYRDLIMALDDDAAEGPRLFTVELLSGTVRHPGILHQRIRITLWCEHSRVPVRQLNPAGGPTGVYDLDVPRSWVVAMAPWLKAIAVVLRGLLPLADSIIGITDVDPTTWQHAVRSHLQQVERGLEAVGDATELMSDESALTANRPQPIAGEPWARIDSSLSRTVRAHLTRVDPGFAGLQRVRVSQSYRWVHQRFVDQYRPPLPEIPTD